MRTPILRWLRLSLTLLLVACAGDSGSDDAGGAGDLRIAVIPKGTTHEFWRSVSTLVDNQVEEYLRRGFNSFTVSFGCTGGQHRSVYFAERLAAHLKHEYPQVNVRLHHREENHWPMRGSADAHRAAMSSAGA